jgi:SAM-dependent methyltransferase
MFHKSADLYDLFYSGKDYSAEVQKLQQLIRKYKLNSGNDLLDVACGTGRHLHFLKRLYNCQGLDLDETLVALAREHNPEVTFHTGDMLTFQLPDRFDVITCLFSAIGYMRTIGNLEAAVRNLAGHLKPGGLLMVEPWFDHASYYEGMAHGVYIDQPGIKACRMNVSRIENGNSVLDFHYLIAREGSGVEHFTERHEVGLFSKDEHIQAFRKCGLQVSYDDQGLIGRGLYLAVMPI